MKKEITRLVSDFRKFVFVMPSDKDVIVRRGEMIYKIWMMTCITAILVLLLLRLT